MELRKRLARIERVATARATQRAQHREAVVGKRIITTEELRAAYERYCPALMAQPVKLIELFHSWGVTLTRDERTAGDGT